MYKTERNEQFGRYLVASKDLNGGELIFEDTPFVVGPKPDSPVLCLSCYGPCPDPAGGVRGCSICSWPVCSSRCETAGPHRGECAVFAAASVRFQRMEDTSVGCLQLDCITPLRMLLERENQEERWEKEVDPLEAHTEARRDKPAWRADQNNVAQFLVRFCKLGDRFDEETVQRVCGILEVNSVEVPGRDCAASVRAIYPRLSLAAHDCVPNIVHTITADKRVEVRAAVPIKEGAPLFLCYAYCLTPTLLRREFLLASKFFHCACQRRSDPTELGTHLSSLKCNKCDNGVIVSSNPLDAEAEWKCSCCEFRTSASAVTKILQLLQVEADQLELLEGAQAIEMREQFIKKYWSALHPRHSALLCVKLELARLYGRVAPYELDELPDVLLERKLELVRDVLRVLDVVAPGASRLRATMVYEQHAPLLLLARTRFQLGLLSREQLRERLREPLRCLREAARVLQREDPRGEGALGAAAGAAADQLEASLQCLEG